MSDGFGSTVEQPEPATLSVIRGPDTGRTYALGQSTTVGRSADNTIVITERHVSRHHLRIDAQARGYIVTDLKSSDGTKLNGVPITTDAWLDDDVVLALGGLVQLRFKQRQESEPEIEPPTLLQTVPLGPLPRREATGVVSSTPAVPQPVVASTSLAPARPLARRRSPLVLAAGAALGAVALVAMGLFAYSRLHTTSTHAAKVVATATRPASASAVTPTGPRTLAWQSTGSGAEMASPAGCVQSTNPNCTVLINGTATSGELSTGPFSGTQNSDFSKPSPNGQGGYCVPVTLGLTLRGTGEDAVLLAMIGTACEVGPHTDTAARTSNGTFTVTGAKGQFTGTTGNGTWTGSGTGSEIRFSASGTLNRP
ncbi:MAG: FHA domain-containing protein [Dehalococcoidia bacterium]